MFYALYDTTARPSNPGYGFANSKRAVAFETLPELVDFLHRREPYDFSAKRISRVEAMKHIEQVPGTNDKGLPVGKITSDDFVTLRVSRY